MKIYRRIKRQKIGINLNFSTTFCHDPKGLVLAIQCSVEFVKSVPKIPQCGDYKFNRCILCGEKF